MCEQLAGRIESPQFSYVVNLSSRKMGHQNELLTLYSQTQNVLQKQAEFFSASDRVSFTVSFAS